MTEHQPDDVVAEPEDRPDPDLLAGEELDVDPWAIEEEEDFDADPDGADAPSAAGDGGEE
jgi:hypothetical protein